MSSEILESKVDDYIDQIKYDNYLEKQERNVMTILNLDPDSFCPWANRWTAANPGVLTELIKKQIG